MAGERSIAAEGYDKLKAKLMSHGLPETVVIELIEHHTSLNYFKGSMIFLEGASTDLIYWVFSGLVDILCPEPEGSRIQVSLLGPGDIFGFMESSDVNGKRGQAFQARARTNVELGLITRDRVCKVLSRLDQPLLVQFGIWLWNAVNGNLGTSIATGRPVAEEVFRAVGNTLMLALVAAIGLATKSVPCRGRGLVFSCPC